MRQLGEVALDELVLTGMSVMGGRVADSPRPMQSYVPAAEELSMLGVAAHADPPPLQVRGIGRRRIGRLAYETMTFDHDPLLPRSLTAERLGGPVTAGVHLCRHPDGSRPWLVWVHRAGQGGPLDLVLSRASRIHQELGYNIACVRRNPRPGWIGSSRAPAAAASHNGHRGIRCVPRQSGRTEVSAVTVSHRMRVPAR